MDDRVDDERTALSRVGEPCGRPVQPFLGLGRHARITWESTSVAAIAAQLQASLAARQRHDLIGRVIEPEVNRRHRPGLMISPYFDSFEISISRTHAVIPMLTATGSIWMLENVDQ